MGHDGTWGFGDWTAMVLMMVLFWGLILTLTAWMIRGLRAKPGEPTSADDVLAARFARGAIDETEFDQRRAELRSARS